MPYLCAGPHNHNQEYSVLGSILGSHSLWNLPIADIYVPYKGLYRAYKFSDSGFKVKGGITNNTVVDSLHNYIV